MVMMTGDNCRTAETAAAEGGGRCVRREVLPEDKAALYPAGKGEGDTPLVMVGDGANDSPPSPKRIGHRHLHRAAIAREIADITVAPAICLRW